MKVSVIGTRGFPDIQGGVEKHCESLYPRIGKKKVFVTVFRRKPYVTEKGRRAFYPGVAFKDLRAWKNKNFETILHSFAAAVYALADRPDIVHIHNIGPALVLPLLKLFGIKTVVTYHSPNYLHSKWNRFAKMMLRLGEIFIGRLADTVIFVSASQAAGFSGKKVYIPNGVDIPIPSGSDSYLREIDVRKGAYVLAVARFAPEKGLDLLIRAFQSIQTDKKLVIAGDADHETDYSRKIRKLAGQDKRVILTGYIGGEKLSQIYANAGLFVLPSYHEGMPIALLEAMGYGLPVIASDIPANREVGLHPERYFKTGDMEDLRAKVNGLLEKSISTADREKKCFQIQQQYNWDKIADRTIQVFQNVANGK